MAQNIHVKLKMEVDGQKQVAELGISTEELGKIVKKVQSQVKGAHSGFSEMAKTCGALSLAFGSLNSSMTALAQPYRDFDNAMKAANTMAGKGAEDFETLKNQVNGLAQTVPVARDALARGLYQVISNGVPEDNWISYLEASAKASVGGIADLGEVVNVTSTLIKNYALSWGDAGAIQDKIQATAKNGVTSFEQMAATLPKVAGSAAQLGVSVDELMAAFATLTGVSGNTAEVGTQLMAVFSAIMGPAAKSKKMAEQMGFAFNASAVKAAGGLEAYLSKLDRAVNEYSAKTGITQQDIYKKLFGSVQAIQALIPLTSTLSKTFSENINGMADSSGAIDEAFGTMSATSESAAQRFKNMTAALTDGAAKAVVAVQPYIKYVATLGQAVSGTVALAGVLGKGGAALKSAGGKAMEAAKSLGAFAMANKAVTAGAAGLAVALAAGVVYYVRQQNGATQLAKAFEGLNDISAKMQGGISAETAQLSALFDTLKKSTAGTDEYNRAKSALFERYGETLKAMGDEKTVLSDLGKAYDTIKGKIIETARAKAMSDAIAEASGTYATESGEWFGKLSKHLTNRYGVEGGARVLEKIRATLEEGKAIDRKFIDQFNVAQYGQGGAIVGHSNDVLKAVEGIQRAYKVYNATLSRAKTMFGKASADTIGGGGVMGDSSTPGASAATVGSVNKEKTRLQQINTELDNLKNKYISASAEERTAIAATIEKLNKEKAEIETIMARLDELGKMKVTPQIKVTKEDLFGAIAGGGGVLSSMRGALVGMATNIGEIDSATSELNKAINKANADEIDGLQRIIALLGKKRDALLRGSAIEGAKSDFNALKDADGTINTKAIKSLGIEGISGKIKELQKLLADTLNPPTAKQREEIESLISQYEALKAKAIDVGGSIKGLWGNVSGLIDNVESLTRTLEGNGNAWTKVKAVINSAIAIYEGINSAVKMAGVLSTLFTAAKKKEGAAALVAAAQSATAATTEAGAAGAATTANVAKASSGAMAAHSAIPFVGVALGLAAVAAIIAMMASLPKFAKGGIAYGATLGVFGEYAGANNNPEVVAPLDRLRSLIAPVTGGVYEFRLRGRVLEAACANERSRNKRLQ